MILPLHVKHNIIQMSSTVSPTGLNSFQLIFYYFLHLLLHFLQYLDPHITNVDFQLFQSIRIVCVNTIFPIAARFTVCCGVRDRALASHTGVRRLDYRSGDCLLLFADHKLRSTTKVNLFINWKIFIYSYKSILSHSK